MQEQATTWDLRSIDYSIDGATRLYVVFLLLFVIWSVVASVKFWWLTSTFGSESKARLSDLWICVVKNDLDEVRRRSSRIAKRLPESGLTVSSSLKPEDARAHYVEAFSAANIEFVCRISCLRATSHNVRADPCDIRRSQRFLPVPALAPVLELEFPV
jgi:hypothetical protein